MRRGFQGGVDKIKRYSALSRKKIRGRVNQRGEERQVKREPGRLRRISETRRKPRKRGAGKRKKKLGG